MVIVISFIQEDRFYNFFLCLTFSLCLFFSLLISHLVSLTLFLVVILSLAVSPSFSPYFFTSLTLSSLTLSSLPLFSLTPSFASLCFQLLNKDPTKRMSIEEAFAHPFLKQASTDAGSPKAEASLEVVSDSSDSLPFTCSSSS